MRSKSATNAKAILILIGAFTFAFLLGEAVHEMGHYLAHQAYGNQGVGVHLDPFGGSRILGVTSLPIHVAGVTSLWGPLANLLMGLSTFFLLCKKRKPILLPFLMWGPVSMVQEGVTFSLGLLTPGGDAQWIAAWGIPETLILVIGVLLILSGLVTILFTLPEAGVKPEQSLGEKFIVVVLGFGFIMLIRALHSFFVSQKDVVENFVPLIFALLLSFLVVIFDKVLSPILKRKFLIVVKEVQWRAVVTSMNMAAVIFLVQVLLP